MIWTGKGARAALVLLALAAWIDLGCSSKETTKQAQAAGTAAADSTKADSARTAEKNKEKKKTPEGVPVKVAAVEQGKISSYMLFSSTVEAEETVDVYAQATGLVRRVRVEEGDVVSEGQVLVDLVDDDLRLSVDETHVDYQKLGSQFRRTEEMFSRKLVSREEYERQKFDLEQARIRWERAKLALDHASVRSPADGVVSERVVKLGDRISPSNKLFSLVNMRSLISKVHVPGRELRNLSVGQPAVVTTDFLPDASFPGRIVRISPVVDPGSGTFKVTIGLDDGSGHLRPGMFINAHIVTATHNRALLVPKRAVVYDDGQPHVFVVADSTARKVRLNVGFEDSENLEILGGLETGDRIVVVGQNGLKDQARIRIIEGEGLRIPQPDTTTTAARKDRTS